MNVKLRRKPGEAPGSGSPARRLAAAMVLLFLALLPAASEAAHPFYEQLLREGSAALSRQDYEEAQELLRLASFGFLSEPQELARSLVQLALAQAEGGQEETFQATFSRILEIEERFGAYSRASLDAGLTRRFEDVLATRVPLATLRSTPAFRPVARRLELERIRGLPKGEQHTALEALLADDPADAETALMLAENELQAGNGEAAVQVLEGLLRERPGHPTASCRLGQALAASGRCTSAIERLEACADSPRLESLATPLLECYTVTGRWFEADSFLRSLDGSVASVRPVERLAKRIQRGKRRALKLGESPPVAVEEATIEEPPIEESQIEETQIEEPRIEEPQVEEPQVEEPRIEEPQVPPAETRPVAVPEPPPPLPEEAQGKLDEARRQLARARLASDLERPLSLAKEVADRYPAQPEAQHLVAEIAYRSSNWQEAAEYFRRGGDPGDGRPHLLFFMAVSFYEAGDFEEAREMLRRCLPQIQKTAFVREYEEKILN